MLSSGAGSFMLTGPRPVPRSKAFLWIKGQGQDRSQVDREIGDPGLKSGHAN